MNKIFRIWNKNAKEFVSDGKNKISKMTLLNLSKYIYDYTVFPDYLVVQQFTGMKDTNGIEIFEGDILCEKRTDPYDTVESSIGLVYFVGGSFMIDGDGPLFDHIESKSPDILQDYTVIGNRYENPEYINLK